LLATVQSKDAESILGEFGLAGQLKKMLAERMLSAELTYHLAQEEQASKNRRNGTSPKTVLAPGGELQLDVPRDWLPSFEPRLVAKHQRRMLGFDDHVISMYARGMTVREIQGHSAGVVWHRGLTRPDFHHHRRSNPGSHAMATAAAGGDVPDCVLRCVAPEDPR
jgi:transposase-like protein